MRKTYFSMDNLTDKERALIFDQMGKPRFWIMKAESLFRAAELLHAQQKEDEKPRSIQNSKTGKWEFVFSTGLPSLADPCWYMSASTIEVALKAIILQRHPELLKGGIFDKSLHTHDLSKLAKLSNLTLTKAEEAFCLVGSRSLEDWGKYPISKRVKPASTSVLAMNAPDVFFNLYKRILKEYTDLSD